MSSLLDSWKPPAGDTGIGLHCSAWYGDTRYTPNREEKTPQLDADIALMKAMGMTRAKLLVRGNSQLHAVRAFADAGFTVGGRYYSHIDEGFGALPENELSAYQKAGMKFCEGRINEYDNEAQAKPSAAGIELLGDYWRSHADTCAHVGLIPLSPAFEGDRLEDWVIPMVQYMLDRGWGDAVKGSIIAGHFRTGRYYGPDRLNTIPESVTFPPEADPNEPGDRTGFVFRSYERWQKKLTALLGYMPIMQSTETGIEPHECRNDLQLHAELNKRMAQMPWPMDCIYYWIGIPGGMGDASAWIGNTRYANPLPVLKAFMDMPRPVRPGVPVVPEPDPVIPADPVADLARETANKRMEKYPWGEKYAYRHGLIPWGGQIAFDADRRYYGQPVYRRDGTTALVVFAAGEYTDAQTRVIEWEV
jgi:hypothetical protein